MHSLPSTASPKPALANLLNNNNNKICALPTLDSLAQASLGHLVQPLLLPQLLQLLLPPRLKRENFFGGLFCKWDKNLLFRIGFLPAAPPQPELSRAHCPPLNLLYSCILVIFWYFCCVALTLPCYPCIFSCPGSSIPDLGH